MASENIPADEAGIRKELADYAMVLDMVGQLAGFASVAEQVERVFEILTVMCGPARMSYLALDDDAARGELITRPAADPDRAATIARLSALREDYMLTESGQGFIFRVDYGDVHLCVIEVEQVTMPELLDHYLNLALNIRSVIGLALSNARLYQSELISRGKVQSHADQLSLLHQIGLGLNREPDREKMLKTVLDGACQLTSAKRGAMLLGGDGAAGLVSLYHAPGFQAGEFAGGRADEIFQFASRIAQETERDIDVLLIAGHGQAGPGPESAASGNDSVGLSPAGVSTGLDPGDDTAMDRELMIGILRDTHGRMRGYFLLGEKIDGESYTSEDEEIIALLAAQSSVALTSAENFEREHRVAEALLDALLPKVPVRDDIDVGLLYRSAGRYKIGGDFYEFMELGEGRVAVAVGDVCGKGLEAATHNAMIKYMLRAFLGDGLDPGSCLERLNRAVLEELPPDRFVTMCLALIETRSGDITFSSAGHPNPIICAGSGAVMLEFPSTLPLGVLEDFTFPNAKTSLTANGSILLYTDGIIEARSNEEVQFGQERLVEAFPCNGHHSAQELVQGLLGKVMKFTQGELKDDAAMLLLSMNKAKHG